MYSILSDREFLVVTLQALGLFFFAMPIVCQRSVAFPNGWVRTLARSVICVSGAGMIGLASAAISVVFMQVTAFLLAALAVKWSLEVWHVYRHPAG